MNMDPEGNTDRTCRICRYQNREDRSVEEDLSIQGATGRRGGSCGQKAVHSEEEGYRECNRGVSREAMGGHCLGIRGLTSAANSFSC